MKTHSLKAIIDECESVSQILKSLSHPVRLKILCQVIEKEKSVGDLTRLCEISQSSMSQFLGRMKEEGMLESRREGHHIYYRISDPKLLKLLRALKEIYC